MIAKQKVHSFKTAFDYNHKKTLLADPKERAEVLDHNFIRYDPEEVLTDVAILKQLKPKLKNDGYHVALSFAKEDILDNKRLIAIAKDYMEGMGFDPEVHSYALWKHNDGEDHEHIHMHLLLCRIGFVSGKATVVSDSNNYRRSEAICRKLEKKYDLVAVRSSKDAPERAPNKDELEMIQRTGKASDRMLMQEQVKMALTEATSLEELVLYCQVQGVHLLFNRSETTGRISGITYLSENGFMAKGQKLGNLYKWNNIKDRIHYEQSRDGEIARQTNINTRARFESILDRTDSAAREHARNALETSETDRRKPTTNFPTDFDNLQNKHQGYDGEHPNRTEGDEKAEQDIEEAIGSRLSHGVGTAAGGIGGLFAGLGAIQIDEDDAKRKRRKKR